VALQPVRQVELDLGRVVPLLAREQGGVVTADFFVPGVPVPKGSMRAFAFKRKNGKLGTAMSHDNARTRPWLAQVSFFAHEALAGATPADNAVRVTLRFLLPRPQGHYGSGRNAGQIKASAPARPAVKPDLDKLVRCVLDALNGVAWVDDGRVVEVVAAKAYGVAPGVRVEIADA
jgi:Holliday junction resolvase RusA-like endonuclease